jgi:hypothetical protein
LMELTFQVAIRIVAGPSKPGRWPEIPVGANRGGKATIRANRHNRKFTVNLCHLWGLQS